LTAATAAAVACPRPAPQHAVAGQPVRFVVPFARWHSEIVARSSLPN
jgi:hypothetical protein